MNATNNNTENKIEVRVPFEGFYQSMIMAYIDLDVESSIDYHLQEKGITDYNIYDVDYDTDIDYFGIAKRYLKEIVWAINYHFEKELQEPVTCEFSGLESPSYYNFTTDKLYGLMSLSDIEALYNLTDKNILRKLIYNGLKRRDGFIPNYSNNIDDWGDLEEWDYNQYYYIFEALILQIAQESYGQCYQYPCEALTRIIEDSCLYERLYEYVEVTVNFEDEENEDEESITEEEAWNAVLIELQQDEAEKKVA